MRLTYDAISPFTGRKTVLVEYDEQSGQNVLLCMETGYQTYDNWLQGSVELERFEEKSPDCVLETCFVEPETKQVWYKTTIFRGGTIVYPDGEYWKVATFKPFVEGTDDRFGWATMKIKDEMYIPDDANAVIFDKNQFEDAFFEFYSAVSKQTYTTPEN